MPVQRRRISDAGTIRALAHPIRLRLLQLLLAGGPLTATEAGEAIGESPASASFHLRQLARFGYIEEAGRQGRRRPWQAVREIIYEDTTDLDPEATLASQELDRVLADQFEGLHRTWLASKAHYPENWRRGANDTTAVLHITAEQAFDLNSRILALVEEFLPTGDVPPDGALPAALVLQIFPMRIPAR